MYEIWLMLNIVYEIALPLWPALLVLLLVWLGLLAVTRRQLSGVGLRRPLLAGAVAAVLVLLGLPTATQSGLGNLDYWVDWAVVSGLALAAGAAVVLYAWPLLALRGRHAAGV